MWLTCQAYRELLSLEFWLLRKNFPAIHDKVRNTRVPQSPRGGVTLDHVSRAVDFAGALYFKPILCLQRSAAAVCLLKKCGYPAVMVIGVQQLPFAAHAWVELGGLVVGDKPYVNEIYSELCRC